MTPSADQVAAFTANGGFAPGAVSTVVLGFVFAILLLWGVWAMRTAYVGWAEHHLTQRQFLGVIVRFVAMYLVLLLPPVLTPRRVLRHERSRYFPSHSARIARRCCRWRIAATPLSSFADLPTLEDPSRGQGSGIMRTLQNYGYDIVLLIALLVVASMFVGVCYHAYTRYAEIHTGRAAGQFGLTVAVGAILLVVGIWLLTKATGVL
jgi:integrating conjugative element membrane protein (TIGR03745 family)/integrating conjugative element protein (TIGR03758 family)